LQPVKITAARPIGKARDRCPELSMRHRHQQLFAAGLTNYPAGPTPCRVPQPRNLVVAHLV
jgi:hypothetical protein